MSPMYLLFPCGVKLKTLRFDSAKISLIRRIEKLAYQMVFSTVNTRVGSKL